MDAFRDWQQALSKRGDVSSRSYPKLDHLFIEGTGPASDADYARPRNSSCQQSDRIKVLISNRRVINNIEDVFEVFSSIFPNHEFLLISADRAS